jgi:hypothetical protein
MNLSRPAYVAAALGGVVWLARWLMDANLGDGASLSLLGLGMALVALALAVAGAGLVSSSAPPLRVLVALAFPLLVWSVVEFFRPADDALFVGLLGVVGLLVGAVGVVRARPEPRERPRRAGARRAGSHAA